MQNIIGIDVSKEKHDIVLVSGEKKYHRVISNDMKGFENLVNWLKTLQITKVHACLEATGQYGDGVAECLFLRGH